MGANVKVVPPHDETVKDVIVRFGGGPIGVGVGVGFGVASEGTGEASEGIGEGVGGTGRTPVMTICNERYGVGPDWKKKVDEKLATELLTKVVALRGAKVAEVSSVAGHVEAGEKVEQHDTNYQIYSKL